MAGSPTLLWFRQDLRLQDNPALAAAVQRGRPIIPVYILDGAGEGNWALGGASRWWLHHSLEALAAALGGRDSRLILAAGDSGKILRAWIRKTRAGALYWNRRYEPAVRERDRGLAAEFSAAGVAVKTFNSALLFEPDGVANRAGRPFQVFSPFWRHCLSLAVGAPGKIPAGALPAPRRWPKSAPLSALGLRPSLPWADGFARTGQPGEAGGAQRLKGFMSEGIGAYDRERNRPDHAGTSRLSPWLHFGEIGPRQIWAAAKRLSAESGVFPASKGVGVFLAELGWREFAHHLLYHYPETPAKPLRLAYARFPWASDPGGAKLRAWQQGRTGYPIVDAGMRELWRTGRMHNRVRMIAGSFLVKHLRLPWQQGAAWFWDTLVDADLANNTLGWQWTAGCGADAAPYFRIFAPVLQGRKFDPEGAYVRRWVPELARLPTAALHAPWELTELRLAAAGVRLGETYPRPVVDHATARREALAAFGSLAPKAPGV
jgi:deoxyribodipyrimidine photo-lyase